MPQSHHPFVNVLGLKDVSFGGIVQLVPVASSQWVHVYMSDSQPLGAGLPPWLRDYVCGAFAGGANVLVGYPFDTVKVTLQNAHPAQFSGPQQCSSHILSSKGVRSPPYHSLYIKIY